MKSRSSIALLLLALAVSPWALAPEAAAGKRPVTSSVVEDALAVAPTDRKRAIAMLQAELSQTSADAAALARVQLHLGEQHRLAGDLDSARLAFEAAIADPSTSPGARLGLALLDPDHPGRQTDLQSTPDKDALPTQNADRWLILAGRAHAAGDPEAVRDATRRALAAAAADAQVLQRVEASLSALAKGEAPALPGASGSAAAGAAAARDAYWKGDVERARTLAEAALASEDAGEQAAARYVLARIEKRTVLQPDTIGVLLPLSGKFEAAGNQVKTAFELGYREAATKRRLVFVDSGSTPETAVKALEKLTLEQGVIGVVGPLLTPETDAVVAAAEALGTPLVSLSQSLTDSTDRQWTLQAMVTSSHQTDALVDFVMTTREMKAFAIFAPDNAYGRRAADDFRAAVEQRGGTIAAEVRYDPEATDLLPFAKKLGRKDYTARAAEFREIKRVITEKGGNPQRAVLPPILDFDALFLPDNAARVPVACAALAYEEFPLGDFRTSKEGRTIPVLGLSGWNNADLVARGGEYTRSSYFTDAFAELDPAAAAFGDWFRAEAGHSPSALEAVAVDAGRLVAAAALSPARTVPAFRDALLAAKPGDTATGATGFDATRKTALHQIRILSIDREKIYQVHPAVEPPPAPPTP
jgi:ABC-type branched-subunit amino acid transport system substrate-binding protein